jgi:hypothetical protein
MSCHPAQPPCIWHPAPIPADGFLFGTDRIASATDGGLVASWDGKLPAVSDGGTFRYDDGLAADGHRSVFARTDLWAGSPVSTLLTEMATDGATVWQRVFEGSGFARGIALDEGGTTHVLFDEAHLVLDSDGGTLFTAPLAQPAWMGPIFLAAGGGRVYLGDRTLLDARDGSVSATLAFQPIGPALLTASRIVVQENVPGSNGPLHSVDLATGALEWTREMAPVPSPFRIAGRFVLVLDPGHVIHFVQDDGRDALACQLPSDARGVGVLLERGRLVVPRGTSIDAYDLPIPLDGD